MRIVLLSGGSGKRLWPLSNEIRSKIFLKLLSSPDGGKESMIQRVCRQLDAAGLLQSTSIITHQSQVEITKNHVGERIPIISEPYKRGTFTAVALAAAYFHSKMHADSDEPICIIPVDLFVEDSFFNAFHKLPDILNQSRAELALLGTTPTHSSSQYGYIVPSPQGKTEYYPVAQFVEKPDESQASLLIQRKALWNCGVFAFSLRFMLAYLRNQGLPVQYEEWLQRYEQLPELSFDHEVVEKTRHSVVIPYNGTWNDLGSWETLTDYLNTTVIGSGGVSDDSGNTHLVNELSCPVHVIGVSNIIVAASSDGILVANKTHSNRIKQQISGVHQRPMYEESSWGTYRVLDHSRTNKETETLTKKIELLPGKDISYHSHRKRRKIWTVISGTGELLLEDLLSPIQTGDVIQIPCGAMHAAKAVTPLAMIEIQIGSELSEEDITRTAVSWEKAIECCKNLNKPHSLLASQPAEHNRQK